jgi:hypothetical protein
MEFTQEEIKDKTEMIIKTYEKMWGLRNQFVRGLRFGLNQLNNSLAGQEIWREKE